VHEEDEEGGVAAQPLERLRGASSALATLQHVEDVDRGVAAGLLRDLDDARGLVTLISVS
jgi:hypothetical protein